MKILATKIDKILGYNLFWNEEKKVYHLRDGEKTIGILPDDTKFANDVMEAFNARLELERLRYKLYDLKENMKDVVNVCEQGMNL